MIGRREAPAPPLSRRDFVRTTATASLALAAPEAFAEAGKPAERFVGVHVAAHSFYDEGVDHVLDFLQRTAGVNALFVTGNSYYGAMFRPKEAQGDHGVPIRDGRGRKVTPRFFATREEAYAKTTLRHRAVDASLEYAGREIFSDLAARARQRGMKVYERMYEPGGEGLLNNIANAEKVLTVRADGKSGKMPCWNHPDYLEWVGAQLRDLFGAYPLDGLQYGAERNGPLSRLIDWPRAEATCFCDFCRERARREGVDFERAREGLAKMSRFIASLERGDDPGPDGPFAVFLRTLFEYPEILAWETMHYRAGEELHVRVRDAVKSVRPGAAVGRHVDHAQTAWDVLFRAAMPYERMTPASEFLKLSTYHDILGPRLAGFVKRYHKHILRQIPPPQLLELFYALTGHDPKAEPSIEQLAESGLSAEFVYRETKRAVDGVAGRAAIYSGIAIDIPRGAGWGGEAWPSDPEEVYRCVRRAFDAGAQGIVICREYEEMREPSLRAIGRAVREAT